MFAKSSQNVINIINRVTAFVVVLGAAALFIVLAGFAGLKHFTLSFSSTFDPDLKILPAKGKYLSLTSQDTLKLQQISQVAHFTKVLEEQVFLTHNQKNHIAYIKGVDEQYPKVNEIDSIIVLGNWQLTPPSVVVGGTIFNKLGLNLTDASSPLQIVVPKAGKGSILSDPMPYRQAFSVVQGIYQLTEDLDKKYVFSSLDEARFLLGVTPDKVSAIEVKLVPQADEKTATEAIARAFEQPVIVKNRVQLNDALYRMLNTENIAVYLIFILVLIIALFNLVGAIIMMILDKRKNLYTLFALGMTQRQIRAIFFLQGVIVSLLGAVFGVGLGIGIAWLQKTYPMLYINPNATVPIAYPMDIRLLEIVVVFFTIFVLGILASAIGASRTKINH